MKRIITLVLALFALSLCALAEEEKALNVFTWEGYIDDTTLSAFTAETGIQVNYITFTTNEEMLLKLRATQSGQYDIILASDYIISAARKQGLLMPLDKSKLTGWDNLNPDYLNQYFDPGNVYTVPYAVGSPMIVYNPALVEGEITRFSDLWSPQFENGLWLISDARVILGEVLHMLGYSYNTTDALQLAEATVRLNALRPNIRVLDYDMSYNYLTVGEARAAYIFTPFVALTMLEDPSMVAVYPEDGIGFGIDSFAIAANAPHPDNAHRFLDYYLRPEVAKTVAEAQCYINPNRAADALLDPDFAALSPFHIPESLLASAEYVEDLGDGEYYYQDIWAAFKLADE